MGISFMKYFLLFVIYVFHKLPEEGNIIYYAGELA